GLTPVPVFWYSGFHVSPSSADIMGLILTSVFVVLMLLPAYLLAASILATVFVLLHPSYRKTVRLVQIGKITLGTVIGTVIGSGIMLLLFFMCGGGGSLFR